MPTSTDDVPGHFECLMNLYFMFMVWHITYFFKNYNGSMYFIWDLQSVCKAAATSCKEKGKNISKLAVQYSLLNKEITSVLVGMRSVEQVLFYLHKLSYSVSCS